MVLYMRVGREVCPEHSKLFNVVDKFDRAYVTRDEKAPRGPDGMLPLSPAEANSVPVVDDASAQRASICSRLLLEWGLAQHFFGKVSRHK